MARLRFSEPTEEGTGNTILKDGDPDQTEPPAKKKMDWLKKANKKAAGILLCSVVTKPTRGELV